MKNWKYYKKIFNYFKEKKLLIFIYALTSLLIVGANTIIPLINAKSLEAITKVDLNNILKFAGLLLIIDIVQEIISFVNRESSHKIQDDVEIKIKEDVSKELFNLELKNFDKEGTGFFAERINNEPRTLAGIFNSLRYNFTSLLSSTGIMIYIFYVNYVIGIYFFLISIVFFIIRIKRTKRWEKDRKQYNDMHEKYTSNFGELIRGIKDIKVLNLKDVLIKKTVKNQKDIIKYDYEIRQKDEKLWSIESALYSLLDFSFIVISIILIKNNLLNGANLLVIYMYKGRATDFVGSIGSMYRNYKEFNLSIERLYEVIDGEKYTKETYGNIALNDLNGNIEFKDVYFNYDNKIEVLKGVNFQINSNETIGIVGKSGVGKTTIFNLLNKLYTVDKGNIYLDGKNLNSLTEESIRRNISTITQNPYIFNMSIKDNLKIVNSKISDEEIKEKCRLCLLDEYINDLDKKYDTLVGENGVILSGGLKQRLAIARALIKNSKIILLDEATSSLDNETQDYIHESIKKIRKDYTILIIAHRLSTVIDCDKILVVDDGKVVGFDTHENLVKNNKVYKKLYKKELQAK